MASVYRWREGWRAQVRHEAASALLEAGYTIPQTALVTGHRKLETLQRYVQLDPAEVAKKPR